MKKLISKLGYVLIGSLSTFVGFGVYVGIRTYTQHHSVAKSFESVSYVVSSVTVATKQPPTQVYIPKLKSRLPVQASVVWGNDWDLFDKAVAWLSTSAIPGEGNVVLYAHDWTTLWGDLYKVKQGDTVEVFQNTKKTIYTVTESRAVDAHDVQAILSQENQLTLFTCEGTFDQKRRVVYAHPRP